jgi:hypothetical protein
VPRVKFSRALTLPGDTLSVRDQYGNSDNLGSSGIGAVMETHLFCCERSSTNLSGSWCVPGKGIEVIGYYAGNLKKASLQGRLERRLGMKRETTVPRATTPAETQNPVMNPCSVGSPLAKV